MSQTADSYFVFVRWSVPAVDGSTDSKSLSPINEQQDHGELNVEIVSTLVPPSLSAPCPTSYI